MTAILRLMLMPGTSVEVIFSCKDVEGICH